jgi:hypothetical protein
VAACESCGTVAFEQTAQSALLPGGCAALRGLTGQRKQPSSVQANYIGVSADVFQDGFACGRCITLQVSAAHWQQCSSLQLPACCSNAEFCGSICCHLLLQLLQQLQQKMLVDLQLLLVDLPPAVR